MDMLAKIDWNSAPCERIDDLDYTGFPYWVALAAEPNRERKAADWLKDKLNIHVYWPHYTVQRRRACRSNVVLFKAVLPGILLAPSETMEIENRDMILDWARLRRVRLARFITKAEVEVIRDIEANLNIPQTEKTFEGKIGDRVCFRDEVKAAFLGEGTIIEIAPGNRITVKLTVKLIGTDVITVSGAELEVLKPSASRLRPEA